MRLVATADPTPPRALRPELHPDLETACLKAMRREPESRYASAAAFEADLRRFLAGEPILARPVGALERRAAWVRRHRALSAAVLLAALGAAGTGGWAGRSLLRRQSERDAAERKAAETTLAATPLAQDGQNRLKLAEDAQRAGDLAAATPSPPSNARPRSGRTTRWHGSSTGASSATASGARAPACAASR
jgi:hypothetical protein